VLSYIKDYLFYKIPRDWKVYLFGEEGLDSFHFYPVVLGVLLFCIVFTSWCFLMAKRKRKNRSLCKFFKITGKVALFESLFGAFVIFSRWQTLGIFAIRFFLILWLLSIPFSIFVLLLVYIFQFRLKIKEDQEKLLLERYKPTSSKG
jgi:hypothetical protein